MLAKVRDHCAALVVATVLSGVGGCYLSHEVPPCSDVPEEERCLTPPDDVEGSDLVWNQSFMHRDPRDGCIPVSVDPSMVEHRDSLEFAISALRAIECMSLCFEDVEVIGRASLPDAPYIHLAPEGACAWPADADRRVGCGQGDPTKRAMRRLTRAV